MAKNLNSLMSEAETTEVGRQFQVLTLVLGKNEYGCGHTHCDQENKVKLTSLYASFENDFHSKIIYSCARTRMA